MNKTEVEPVIRQLCHEWREARGLPVPPDGATLYSFADFKAWSREKHYAHYLDFRSEAGAAEDTERWFDQEMKQTWRN